MVKDFVQVANQDDSWANLTIPLRQLTKNLIELSLEEEMNGYLQRQPYRRSDALLGYRNGYYCRDLDTPLGPLENIAVPRVRSGFFRTCDVAATLKPLLGVDISASCVSRIAKRLAHDVALSHQRPLVDEYQFLFLDGIALRVKSARKSQKLLVGDTGIFRR